MNKLKLTPDEILNTTFKTDLRGYSAFEVDSFLDIILDDYQVMEENTQELLDRIAVLNNEIETLKAKNRELEGQNKALDLSATTSYSSVDFLKRLSRLEEEVYKK